MAMPKAGVSLVVENDQQFKAALSEVNAGLRVNKQQMQLVTEQTREMDDRQAALQQRYEAAQQTLQSYRDKCRCCSRPTKTALGVRVRPVKRPWSGGQA